MKKLWFYYLALLTWIAMIIMCATIILIPVVLVLRDNYNWWEKPFNTAWIYS